MNNIFESLTDTGNSNKKTYLGSESEIMTLEEMAFIVMDNCKVRKGDPKEITKKIMKDLCKTDKLKNLSNDLCTNNIIDAIERYYKRGVGLEYTCKIIRYELSTERLIDFNFPLPKDPNKET